MATGGDRVAHRTSYDPYRVQRRMLEVRRRLETDLQELRLLGRELTRVERQLGALQHSLRGGGDAADRHDAGLAVLEAADQGRWGPN
jgi:hypothetical protein